MKIKVERGGIQSIAADAIIINLFQGVTEPAGAHDHLISVQGETEPKVAVPPYLDLVFCRKD